MPYITQKERKQALNNKSTPGQLNFKITEFILSRIKEMSYTRLNYWIGVLEEIKHRKLNSDDHDSVFHLIKDSEMGSTALMGVLTCVQLELYRRIGAGYEDQKAVENGDLEGFKRLSK